MYWKKLKRVVCIVICMTFAVGLMPERAEAAQPAWVTVYMQFISGRDNMLSMLRYNAYNQEYSDVYDGYLDGFTLYDVDGNGVPELIITKNNEAAVWIYSCVNGKLKKMQTIVFRDIFINDSYGLAYTKKSGGLYLMFVSAYDYLGVTRLYKIGLKKKTIVYQKEVTFGDDFKTVVKTKVKGTPSAYKKVKKNLHPLQIYEFSDLNELDFLVPEWKKTRIYKTYTASDAARDKKRRDQAYTAFCTELEAATDQKAFLKEKGFTYDTEGGTRYSPTRPKYYNMDLLYYVSTDPNN